MRLVKQVAGLVDKAIRQAVGYLVAVEWDNGEWSFHYTYTSKGALEWTGLYPQYCRVAIYNRYGQWIATRN